MTTWTVALSDRLSPIVVQQVRRGLRGRTFSLAFAMLLVACVVISLVGYVSYSPARPASTGPGLFAAFFACLALLCFVIIPFGAHRSLLADRDERVWPLVILTRLTPAQILLGTVGSYLVQGALYACVLGPFLLFSYLFQGIPLVGVALVLGVSALVTVFLVVCSTAAATLADGRLAKSVSSVGLVVWLLWTLLVLGPMSAQFLINPHLADFDELAKGLGLMAAMLVSYGQLAFFVAVGRLTFQADNHARAPRLALLMHVVLLLGCSAALGTWGSSSGSGLHGLFVLVQVFIAGVVLSTAPDGLSKRLQDRPPRFTLFGMLLPGASRGHLFFLLLLGLVALGRWAVVAGFGEHLSRGAIARDAALAAFYVSLPVMLGRGPLRSWVGSPVALRTFSVFLLGAASLASVLAAAAFGSRPEDEAFNFMNPFMSYSGMLEHPDRSLVMVVGTLALMTTIAAQLVLRARDREARGG